MESTKGRTLDDTAVESWRTHVYSRLDPSMKQIRILKLFPSSDLEEDPKGELYILGLADRSKIRTIKFAYGQLYDSEMGMGSFAAISYRWDDSERHPMILNDRVINIGKNARDTLRYLRKVDKVMHLWIDAICINQKDNIEKSQQVSMMAEIYTLACPVYIWTGQGLKPSYKALGLVSQMAQVMITTDSEGDPSHFRKKWAVWREMRQTADAEWKHLFEFASLPVWKRVWVQQEIILSSARYMGVVVAGKFELNLFTVIYGMRAIWSAHAAFGPAGFYGDRTDEAFMTRAALAAQTVTTVHDSWFVSKSIPERILVSTIHGLEVTEPKDYVYGMLALLPYLAESVDGNKPITEVYVEAMFAILKRAGSLSPILQSSHHWKTGKDNMPSWVHDWREKKDGNFSERWAEFDAVYNASNGYPVRLERQGDRLGVAAYPLFVIVAGCLGPATEFDYQILEPPIFQRDYVFSRLGFVGTSQNGLYPTFDEAFERAILLDLQIGVGNGPPQRLVYPGAEVVPTELSAALDIIRGRRTGPREDHPDHEKVFKRLCNRLRNTRIGVSARKHISVLPQKTQIDDVVCILAGSNVPFVLRRKGTLAGNYTYQVIGGAYVQDVMDGEAIQKKPGSENKSQADAYITRFEDIWLV